MRIDCEDDLWRHYALSQGWARLYLKEDNDTCIHPIPAGATPGPPRAPESSREQPRAPEMSVGATLGPPGWGGAYNGSKPRCLAGRRRRPRRGPSGEGALDKVARSSPLFAS